MSTRHLSQIELAARWNLSPRTLERWRFTGEGDDPREYVEVALKVSERKYTSWPLHIRKLFEPARTVRAGAQSFSLILNKEGV